MDYWIGLGSNIGAGARQITQALDLIDKAEGIRVVRRSHLYRTPPWGYAEQDDFTNAVALLRGDMAPGELLQKLQEIETAMGRDYSARRWGPRTIDLDLLLAGELILHLENVTVPHPRMHRRAFVLRPLAELSPGLLIPARGRVGRLLAGLPQTGIERVGPD